MTSLPHVALLLAGTLAVAIPGISGSPRAYTLSRDGSDEILFFGRSGGLRFFDAQYKIHGDGRLVREVVNKIRRDVPLRRDEIQLSSNEVTDLFDQIVAAELPTMEIAELLPPGEKLISLEDGRSFFIILNFAEYELDSGPVEGFTARLSIPEPELQAQEFPDVPQLRAFVDVVAFLLGRFETSDLEAIKRGSDGQ